MKAINIRDGAGPPESLFIDEIPEPEATGDKILVRIAAFGLNRMDLTQRSGKYPMKPEWGAILGVEFSGTVERKGPDGMSALNGIDRHLILAYCSIGNISAWR